MAAPSFTEYLNELVRLGHRRAAALEPRLAALLEPILARAADQAAERFSALVASGAAPAAVLSRSPSRGALAAPGSPWEPVLAAAPTSASTMVALYPLPEEAAALAVGDEPAGILHVTLAYLGETTPEQLAKVTEALAPVAAAHAPLVGAVAGAGYFSDLGDGYPAILLPDVPGLVELRVAVTEALARAGVDYARNHGFQAHLTLAYVQDDEAALGRDVEALFGLPLHFDRLCLVRGDVEAAGLPLVGPPPLTAAADPFLAELAAAMASPVTDLRPTASTGFVVPIPVRGPALTAAADWSQPFADELVDIEALVAELRTKTDPVRLAAIEAMMGEILDGNGLSFDPRNPHAQKILEHSGSQVTHVAETTRENVRRIVVKSYAEGLSIPDTAKAIRKGMRAASPVRATLIARTELVGAVNGGSLAAVRIVDEHTGVRHMKQWLTAPGARYPRHEIYPDLDGQTVGLDEYFVVGYDELDAPGDPNGSPEEVCNCRCAVGYIEEADVAPPSSEPEVEGDPAPPPVPALPVAPPPPVPGLANPVAGRLDLKTPVVGLTTAGGKALTQRQVLARMQRVLNDFRKFYGVKGPAKLRYEPDATAAWGTDARTLVTPSGEQEIWVGAGPVEKAMDAEMGVFPFRQVSHEAAHTIQREGMPGGPLHDLEEGGAEILSLRYWAERGQPFDFRDAARVGSRWTDPGAESLANSVVYRDQVVETMRRAASRVGWDRDQVTAEVLRAMRGNHNERVDWLNSTDATFALPEGITDAPGLARWLVEEPEGAGGPVLTDGPATAALDDAFADWGANLTREEINALYTYRETKGFQAINKFLRDGGPDVVVQVADEIPGASASEVIAQIDAVVARAPASPVDLDLLVFRGIRDKHALFKGTPKVGDVFVDPAYTSTTTEFDIAAQRYTKEIGANVSASNPNAAVLEVVVPKGTRGAWMRASDSLEDQGNREFMLGRDTEFRVVKVYEKPKYEGDFDEMVTVVRVEVVPKAALPEKPPNLPYSGTPTQIEAQIVSEQRAVANELKGRIVRAFDRYQGSGYMPINNYARELGRGLEPLPAGPEGEAALARVVEHIESLDEGIAQFELQRPLTVYRGAGRAQPAQLRTKIGTDDVGDMVGRTIRDDGYLSTSIDELAAAGFADVDGLFFEIQLPEGFNAASMNTILGEQSGFGSERELVLPRGVDFKIVKAFWDKVDIGLSGRSKRVLRVVLEPVR